MRKIASPHARRLQLLAACTLLISLALAQLPASRTQVSRAQSTYLLSLNRPTYSSSAEGGNTSDRAVDGSASTIWSSVWGVDPQWIYIDLGANATVSRVVLRWEAAYASAYRVEISADEFSWTPLHTTSSGDGGVDDLAVSGSGRYLRLYGTQRALAGYGYALYELEVYGTGGANPPPAPAAPNVALNRPVSASSIEVAEWIAPGSTNANLAVDGNPTTRWGSDPRAANPDSQWLSVDLGGTRTIGRVVLSWETAYGRVYDLQVSNDAASWSTVYRQLNGAGSVESIPLYARGRYLRLLGHARGTPYGYSLFELAVYDYVAGDQQTTYSIPALPPVSTTTVGAGSYVADYRLMQPRYPRNKGALSTPLPSNKWWTSLLVNPTGNGIVPLPFRARFQYGRGLGLLAYGAPYVTSGGGAIETAADSDFYLNAASITGANVAATLKGYSDWAVDVNFSDSAADKLRVTLVKGSPYVFSQFNSSSAPEIYSPYITRFFDDANAAILTSDGASIGADHIGFQVTNAGKTRYYGLFGPSGTVFRRVGSKLKITLGSGATYLSVATLPGPGNLNYLYQHAYAFVTGTRASWAYDPASADVSTTFESTVSLKRSDRSGVTLMGLFPHQWKVTTTSAGGGSLAYQGFSYQTVRGQLKIAETNSFSTRQKFYGVTPSFAEPTASGSYSRATMQAYLNDYKAQILADYWVPDPYWQGKKLHTLSMAILIADQIGDAASKDQFVAKLREILVNWYTYGGSAEYPYYMYYSPTWGTLNGDGGDHGMAVNLSDHHFLWAYFTFASSVLATYDDTFVRDYGDMVEHLVRDYAALRNDPSYPFARNFDPYEGHSWAGGYGDNDSGNNQESASEALFGWAGVYLWGLVTGKTGYRDLGIWGFTLEENAVEQYWFNYDQTNWPSDWRHGTVGILYGTAALYGTYFSGEPEAIYGIHWLPTAPYISYYGRNPTAVARLYSAMVADNGGQREQKWGHIIWPVQALSDPAAVLAKWNTAELQQDEIFNTYWFVHNMNSMGQRSTDLWATNWSSYSVYKKGAAYTAVIWNPTASTIDVQFRNAGGVVGTISVPPRTTVSGNPWNGVVGPTPTSTPVAPATRTATAGAPTATRTRTATAVVPTATRTRTATAVAPSATRTATRTPTPAACGTTNKALNKPASASTVHYGNTANLALDGNGGTRWESTHNIDPSWIYVDLGSTQSICRVKLSWENAYARSYQVEVAGSSSGPWTPIYSTTNSDGGVDDLVGLAASGRYVRVYGTQRALGYGYSLWELEVY